MLEWCLFRTEWAVESVSKKLWLMIENQRMHADDSLMNHFAVFPVSILGNNRNLIESSKNELETHHRWYVVIWLVESSLVFPSNLGMSVGILTGTGGQAKWCLMGSFASFDKFGNSRVSSKGNFVGANGFWVF